MRKKPHEREKKPHEQKNATLLSCGRVTVGGALTVGDADDSVGRIVASNGAKVAKGGSVTLLGGPMRGTFTTLSPGLILLFRGSVGTHPEKR